MIELYPARMKAVDIILEKSLVEPMLKALHREGFMEISDVNLEEKDYSQLLDRNSTPESMREITSMIMRLEELLSDFELGFKGPSAGIKGMLFPELPKKLRVKRRGIEELKKEFESIDIWDETEAIAEKMSAIKESMEKKRKQLEDIRKMASVDIDLGWIGKKEYVEIKAGEVTDIRTMKKEFSRIEDATYHASRFFIRKKEERYSCIVISYIRSIKETNAALRKAGFHEFDLEGLKGSPAEADREIRKEMRSMEKSLVDMKKRMKSIRDTWRLKVAALHEELMNEKDRVEAVTRLGRTEYTQVLTGWVPEKDVPRLEKLVRTTGKGLAALFVSDPKDPEKTPVKLSNPGWARPFEFLTRMFAPPKYNEIDPTAIIAPIFIIYFGLMLGDALYGVIITLGGLLIYRGMGRVDRGARDFGMVITLAGISTIIFGAIQGGYLGPFNAEAPNLFQIVGISHVPVLIDSLNDPVSMLIIGLILGLAQINLGLILGAFQHARRKQYRELLLAEGTWWVLQPAGFILISGGLFGWYQFSPTVNDIAIALTFIGLGMLIMHEKALFFFGITGFLGNFLSYARILALGLGTAGIALTVNMMTELIMSAQSMFTNLSCGVLALVLGGVFGAMALRKHRRRYRLLAGTFVIFGLVGFVSVPAAFMLVGVLVFVSGHLINTGLQAMGSFVHSLRLQYVEFFGYFYEGGGREFRPFSEKRKITEVDEGGR